MKNLILFLMSGAALSLTSAYANGPKAVEDCRVQANKFALFTYNLNQSASLMQVLSNTWDKRETDVDGNVDYFTVTLSKSFAPFQVITVEADQGDPKALCQVISFDMPTAN